MTIKLYDNDAYQTTCESQIISCEKITDTTYDVILNQTIFFPEEGGQTPDKGTINGFKVIDVQIKDEIITHTISTQKTPFQDNETVSCEIDWSHRFSNMQQHTGEHIFSGFVHDKFGYENVGFHLSDSIVTMDYNGPMTEEEIYELETKSNEAIFAGKKVTCYYPSKEELNELDYRSKKELSGAIRIVSIEDTDVCACCAPHVKTTSEVGILKVIDITNYKGGVRLSILCGMRALNDYRLRLNQCREISHITSAKMDDIVSSVEKIKEDAGVLKGELANIQKNLLDLQASSLDDNTEDVVLFTQNTDTNILRYEVNQLTTLHSGYCAVFNENENGFNFIIGSKNKNCNELAKLLREKLNAKGGGKPEMIQGSLTASKEDISSLILN
ncbi:MAG: hypothetical protein K5675_03345 [Lachnospiraceae bacterium]|nr:hypothetical protein [Lachnospiraceae bacterium]